MDILDKLNERLTIVEGRVYHGGEDYIKKILRESPVNLPEDYINLLKSISGDENAGIAFQVDGGGEEIFIWSAKLAYERRTREFKLPVYEDFINCAWLIGDDVGDLMFFYGEGKEGFGIYCAEAGDLDINDSAKIADSITEFLVDGVGIDIAITL